ncbi:protein PLASTID MOVEMENT IMPAIRED 2-like [Miscanthus floridulus]|uniref:protein PLASTID MOVEMENT IMPAIRED 2-like n=1 Tax=Miscanthus floridulus TaxID=154761 RepID=UPI00345AD728
MDKLNERKAAVDKERAGAESELSRERAMAKELERQIEQTKARASSKRSEPHAMRATRASEKGPGAPSSQEERDAAEYAEVSRELDRARRELLRLRLEVKSAAEAKTKAESDIVASAINIQSNLRAADEMKRLVDEANEEHCKIDAVAQARCCSADVIFETIAVDRSLVAVRASNRALAFSSLAFSCCTCASAFFSCALSRFTSSETRMISVRALSMDVMNWKLPALMLSSSFLAASSSASAVCSRALSSASAPAASSFLTLFLSMARTSSISACRTSTLAVVTASFASISRARLTSFRSASILALVASIEAKAMKKLKAAVEGTMQARASQGSRTMTISRFEYEYLSGRAALVRVVADKKVSAAQAWVQALKAGEMALAARAEAAERVTTELRAKEAEAAWTHLRRRLPVRCGRRGARDAAARAAAVSSSSYEQSSSRNANYAFAASTHSLLSLVNAASMGRYGSAAAIDAASMMA